MNKPETNHSVATVVLAMAKALELASPGDLAAMRRMRDNTRAALFWRMAARHAEIYCRTEDWATIARILALLTPTGQPGKRCALHDSRRRLGTVLCDGGSRDWSRGRDCRPMLSELRFARFLAARGKARRTGLERVARMLASHRPPGPLVSVPDIAWAILNPNTDRIARDYYARLDSVTTYNNEDSEHV